MPPSPPPSLASINGLLPFFSLSQTYLCVAGRYLAYISTQGCGGERMKVFPTKQNWRHVHAVIQHCHPYYYMWSTVLCRVYFHIYKVTVKKQFKVKNRCLVELWLTCGSTPPPPLQQWGVGGGGVEGGQNLACNYQAIQGNCLLGPHLTNGSGGRPPLKLNHINSVPALSPA